MALQFHEVKRGFGHYGLNKIIAGADVPGLAGDSTTVEPGSIYQRTSGELYFKIAAGSGTDKWVKVASTNDVTGISWREPVVVKDSTAYASLAAAETAVNTGTIDGVAVADGDRILFTNITGENKNVFIVSGTPGAGATLVEDTNLATDGDVLMVQDGSDADTQWAYDGTNWVQVANPTSNTELQNIRNFIGKVTAGATFPSYTQENFVVSGESLMTSIDKLDIALGANVSDGEVILAANDINENITALDGFIGTNFATNSVTNITTTTTVDSVPLADGNVLKWIVHVYEAANNRYEASEILALHDGTTILDFTDYANLDVNGKIVGLVINVTTSGPDAIVTVAATNPVNVTIRRIASF